MNRLILLLGLMLLTHIANAQLFINSTPTMGGMAVLDYQTNSRHIKAYYGKARLWTQFINTTNTSHHQIFVGIPLLTQAGTKQISIIDNSTKTLEFYVFDKSYPTQYITLNNKKKKYIKPKPKQTQRIIKERKILQNARINFSEQQNAKNLFLPPATGVITGVFGSRRFYNNQPRRPHTGIDYALPIGTPIIAPANGKVILTGHFFFNGKAIFLDHGQGLISAFIHLNAIPLSQGDEVKQGDIIAYSGQTGRATGPHLHWSLYLNQTVINPSIFLPVNK